MATESGDETFRDRPLDLLGVGGGENSSLVAGKKGEALSGLIYADNFLEVVERLLAWHFCDQKTA